MDAAASEQQHCLLLNSAAFPVLLRHPSISNKQQIVCRLLTCSKAVAAVVTQHCVGLVPLHFEIADWNRSSQVSFVAWFSMHAMLARSLHIRFLAPASSRLIYIEADRTTETQLYLALGKSLQQAVDSAAPAAASSRIELQPGIVAASSSSNPLQIQSYKASGITHEIMGLLPVNRLISLEWEEALPTTVFRAAGSSALRSEDLLPAALGKLTNWCSLSISDVISATNAERGILQALASLQCLTELKLQRLHPCALPLLSGVPVQLRKLQFSCYTHRASDLHLCDQARSAGNYRLTLNHLAALTTLVAEQAKMGSPFVLKEHDELPQNLHTLILDDIHSIKPLLNPQLVKTLRVLQLSTSETGASESAHLSTLQPSSGFRVDLAIVVHYRPAYQGFGGYYDHTGPRLFAAAAPTWKSIKLLRDLDIHAEPGYAGHGVPKRKCDVSVLQEVEALHGLTRLAMCHLQITATANDVSNMLCQLSNLQSLRLVDCWIVGGSRRDNDFYASYPSDDSFDSADPQLQAPDLEDAQHQAAESSHDTKCDQEQHDAEKQSIRLLVLAIAELPRLHCLGIGMIVVGQKYDSMTVEQVGRDRQRCMRPVAKELAVQLHGMQGLTELKLYGSRMACCLDSLAALTGLRGLGLHMGMDVPHLVRLRAIAKHLTRLSKLSVYAGSGLRFTRGRMHDIQELFPDALLHQLDDEGHKL